MMVFSLTAAVKGHTYPGSKCFSLIYLRRLLSDIMDIQKLSYFIISLLVSLFTLSNTY